MKRFLTGMTVLIGAAALGQDSTGMQPVNPLTFSGYAEGYYTNLQWATCLPAGRCAIGKGEKGDRHRFQ